MTVLDRLGGVREGQAVKSPVRVATTASITLNGLQTVDGVSLASGDRVLVKDQTDAKLNGIYVASAGDWQRATDFSGFMDVVKGTRVYVTDGDANGGASFTTGVAVTFGTTEISFTRDVVPTAIASGFATRALAAAATIPSVQDFVQTAGYSTAGDGGGALYSTTDNSAEGNFTVASGKTFYIANKKLTPRMYGAKSDGSDSLTAFTAWAADVSAGIGWGEVDAESYHVSGPVAFTGSDVAVEVKGAITQTGTAKKTLTFSDVTGLRVHGGVFVGKGTEFNGASSSYNGVAALYFSGCSGVYVEGVRMSNHAGSSIRFTDLEDAVFHAIIAKGMGSGTISSGDNGNDCGFGLIPAGVGGGNITVSYPNISDHAFGILGASGTTNFRVVEPLIYDIPGQHGIYLANMGSYEVLGGKISNTALDGFKHHISQAADVTGEQIVRNLTCKDVGQHGFLISLTSGNEAQAHHSVTLDNCLAVSPGGAGFLLHGISGLRARGLHAMDAGTYGAYIKQCGGYLHDYTAERTEFSGLYFATEMDRFVARDVRLIDAALNDAAGSGAQRTYALYAENHASSFPLTIDGLDIAYSDTEPSTLLKSFRLGTNVEVDIRRFTDGTTKGWQVANAATATKRVSSAIDAQITPYLFREGVGEGTEEADTDAFQMALDYTKSLFIPKGQYLLGENIAPAATTNTEGYHIAGAGYETELKFSDGGLLFSGDGGKHANLRDFRITLDGTAQIGIDFSDDGSGDEPTRWALQNVFVKSSTSGQNTGIRLRGGWIGSIFNPIIQSCSTGLLVEKSATEDQGFNSLSVFGGEIQGCVTGLNLKGKVLKASFFGTAIEGNSQHGVLIEAETRGALFSGCYFEANGTSNTASYNDIRITSDASGVIQGVLVQNCRFFRSTGGVNAIYATRCANLTVDESCVFTGHTKRLVIAEVASGYVTGRFRSYEPTTALPVADITANFFGDPYQESHNFPDTSMADATTTESTGVLLTLSSQAARFGEVRILYTAAAAGDVRFEVRFVDVATGDSLTAHAFTHTAVVGKNVAKTVDGNGNANCNFDTRSMRGKDTVVSVARIGADALDTNADAITIQSVTIAYRQ